MQAERQKMSMPIEKAAQNAIRISDEVRETNARNQEAKLKANTEYGKITITDAVSAYPHEFRRHYGDDGPEHPVDLPVSQAEQAWTRINDADAHAAVAKEYAEKYGYLYEFVKGLAAKVAATLVLLSSCQSDQCITWVSKDLHMIELACKESLEQ